MPKTDSSIAAEIQADEARGVSQRPGPSGLHAQGLPTLSARVAGGAGPAYVMLLPQWLKGMSGWLLQGP